PHLRGRIAALASCLPPLRLGQSSRLVAGQRPTYCDRSSGEPLMLVIPGSLGKDTCDGVTRRELLRVGGSALLGLGLAEVLRVQTARAAGTPPSGPGFGKARGVILLYLQGGP